MNKTYKYTHQNMGDCPKAKKISFYLCTPQQVQVINKDVQQIIVRRVHIIPDLQRDS